MSYKAHRPSMELVEVLNQAQLRAPVIQPRPQFAGELPIVYKEICYFHYHDRKMLVRVNAYAFNENRYVDILKEDTNGSKYILRQFVCSPCAEARGMVLRRTEDN